MIALWTRGQKQQNAVDLLQGQGVPSGVVNSNKSIWEDPHLKERGAFEEVEVPSLGKKGNLRPPFRLPLQERRTPTRPAPTLGQDNKFVLSSLLAMPEQEIVALENEHVIGNEPLTTKV